MKNNIVKYRLNPYFLGFFSLLLLSGVSITVFAEMFQNGKWYYIGLSARVIFLANLFIWFASVSYLDSSGIYECLSLSIGKRKSITFWKKRYEWSAVSDVVVSCYIIQDKPIVKEIKYTLDDSGQKKKAGISWAMNNHHQLAAEFLQIAREKGIQITYK